MFRTCILAFLCCVALAHGHTIDVSPGGPVPTLTQARDAVRAWREGAGKGSAEEVHVVLVDGTYEQSAPLVIEPRDGHVSYEAAPGAHPVVSGGFRITGWKAQKDGTWTAEVPGVKEGTTYFQELWINGHRAQRAKTPNRRYFHAVRPALANYPGAPPMTQPESTAFYVEPQAAQILAQLSPEERQDAEVIVFHAWQIARHRVAFVDGASGYLQFTASSRWPFLRDEAAQRFIIENVRSALDEPGEWFLSRQGVLTYKPLPGEDIKTIEAVAPVADALLSIQGDSAQRHFVEKVTFEGIAFAHSRYLLGKEGHVDSQADSKIPAAVMIDGARHVEFENCEIAHTGVYGIWFRKGCTQCAVRHCTLHDLGAGGVRLGEVVQEADPSDRTHHNVVDNCIIQSGGRYFMGSVGVFIAHSGENSVTHCDIGDFYYSGVSAGWIWGYKESFAHHNHVDWNHIHDLGYGVLSDMGGFYNLGPSAGTTASHNHIHDINSYRYGGWGLYTDEGSSGVLMEDNLVHHTRNATFHQHYGADNVVRNNIFAFGEEAQIQRSRIEDHLSFTYSNNIVLFDSGVMLYGQWERPKVRMEQNLYWDLSARPILFGGKSFADWQKQGYDRGSKIADPLFVDAKNGDYHLKPQSPALQMDFQPFDYTQAGVYGDESWKQLAARVKPLQIEREPLPLFVLDDDFETTPVGRQIWKAHTSLDGHGDSILVTDEKAHGGQHSLKFQDAPGLAQTYFPMLNFDINHHQGVSHHSFDLLMETGAIFNTEWRDKTTPYRSGPSLDIRFGKARAGGQDVGDIPVDQWVHVDIICPLGDSQKGYSTLVLTMPDGTKRSYNQLPIKNKDWKDLELIVMVSAANEKTAFYVDNLKIYNEGGASQ